MTSGEIAESNEHFRKESERILEEAKTDYEREAAKRSIELATKMLGTSFLAEIARQLAVMNERQTAEKTTAKDAEAVRAKMEELHLEFVRVYCNGLPEHVDFRTRLDALVETAYVAGKARQREIVIQTIGLGG